MSILTISDPRIRIQPSEELVTFLKTLEKESECPENILRFLKKTKNKKIFVDKIPNEIYTKVEQEFLSDLNRDIENFEQNKIDSLGLDDKVTDIVDDDYDEATERLLNLDDLKWLNQILKKRRDEDENFTLYLHELLKESKLLLPKNEIQPRNPVLEARCVKLRAQQASWEYNKMTKGVDTSRRRLPEDTISYQMKQLNSQLIAVAQFIFSVLAGFAFGFIGVELLIGNLDFGFRLLLGIICALVIALAEIYFLAKKLNEDDFIVDSSKKEAQKSGGDGKKFKFE